MTTQPEQDSTLRWRKSSASGGNGACIEVAQSGSFILVRDSRAPLGAILKFTPGQWYGLVQRTREVAALFAAEFPP
jgi:hypothetical protein